MLKKGKKVKLKAKLKPANATEKVTFKSTNKKVAKVTKKGVVKLLKKVNARLLLRQQVERKQLLK